jgi:hypothetical protein
MMWGSPFLNSGITRAILSTSGNSDLLMQPLKICVREEHISDFTNFRILVLTPSIPKLFLLLRLLIPSATCFSVTTEKLKIFILAFG